MRPSILKKLSYGTAVAAMAVFLLGIGAGAPIAAKAKPGDAAVQMVPISFAELAKKAQPGVVNIRTVKTMKGGGPVFRHFFGNPFDQESPFGNGPEREFKQRSLGSGFIMDRSGYIITNNHVIENADEITVGLSDGREFTAKVVGRDPNTDLALIKIDGAKDLVPLEMGDSDSLEVGSWVVAVGSPFGLEQTVTAGIVSAKGRVIGAGPYDDFIQTDASINPGNSGGPLLNMAGQVVGINTAIVARGQGIGFAIPVNMAETIVAQLKESGSVTRGWLGVGIQNLTPELAEYYGLDGKNGALVTQVYPGDPADKAGVRTMDIIVALNGAPVESTRGLVSAIAAVPVGQKIDITVLRDGKEKTLTATIAKRDDGVTTALSKDDNDQSETLGLQVADVTPEIARRFGMADDDKGVVVMGVLPGGKADEAGVQTGDLITEINKQPVTSVEGLKGAVKKAKEEDGKLKMLVKRPNAGFLVIDIS